MSSEAPVEVDRQVCKDFWEQRAQLAGDPRSVTLEQHPAWTVRLTVSLYQGWLLRRLPRARAKMIVDLACGNGDWTTVLARRTERILAVDFSEGMVAACRARLERDGHADRAELVCGDVSEVPLPRSDLIIAGAVTQYLGDDRVDALLGNVLRALDQDGIFYLRTTVSRTGETQVKADATFQGIYRTKTWFDERVQRAGFEIVESTTSTEFLADEVSRRILGPLQAIVYYPMLGIRKLARRKMQTDVAVYILKRR